MLDQIDYENIIDDFTFQTAKRSHLNDYLII